MFSKELENLIQATLEDGMLEDNEKAALIKRAQNEGVDLDELEIYINSLLQRRQRELNNEKRAREEKYEREKKEALGRVCPKCGNQVPPLTLKCDCGYEFTTNKSVSSVQLFFERINNISLTEAEIDSCSDVVKEKVGEDYRIVKDAKGNVVKNIDDDKVKKLKEKKKLEIISSFPVPNTKEDIIEFLSLSLANSKKKGGLWGTKSGRFLVLLLIGVAISIILGIIMLIWNFKKDSILGTAGIIMFCLIIYGGILIDSTKDPIFEHNNMVAAWRAKFEQVLMKGRSMRGDSDFQQQLDYYENILKKK